jgi:probable F420-dependent oxidoreductase
MAERSIRVGLNVVPVAPAALVDAARLAEELGFESVWSGEHVAVPFEMRSRYPGGKMPFAPDSMFVEPLVMLSHLAAVTTRVRLGVGIYLLPLRDPILAGRAIATLDVLSQGRLDLGIGVGWCEEEFRYVGRDFHKRGKLADELIDALGTLFNDPRPEFHGKFFDFGPIGFEPKPVQRPRPKLHVGGFGAHTLRRAALRGDGYYAGARSPEEVAANVAALRAEEKRVGRTLPPAQVSMISLGPPPDAGELAALASAGVERVVVTPWAAHPGAVSEPLAGIRECARRMALAPID